MKRRDFLKLGAASGMALTAAPLISNKLLASPTDELVAFDGLALAEMVKKGDITPLELVDTFIRRIETLNPKLNAVVYKAYDLAREKAKTAAPQGLFAGVPYLHKVLAPYEGQPWSRGSAAYKDRIATSMTDFNRSIDNNGAIFLGQTTSPEFGNIGTTETRLFGPTHNPWDLKRSPAGSSGGAGAVVAAGIVPWGTASDGGGSIRMPASQCGAFGMKYSRFREIGADRKKMLSNRGCISRTVRDSAAFLSVVADPNAKMKPVNFVKGPSRRRLKIAVNNRNQYGHAPHAEVDKVFGKSVKLLANMGHTVVADTFEFSGEEMMHHFLTLWATVSVSEFNAVQQKLGRKPDNREFEGFFFGLLDLFNQRPEGAVKAAITYFTKLRHDFSAFFGKYDVYMTPVLSEPPMLLGRHDSSKPFAPLMQDVVNYVSYTPLANATGTPSMSVPLYWTDGGLPVGTLFTANFGEEDMLMALAYELEEARPWKNKWAPVSAMNI